MATRNLYLIASRGQRDQRAHFSIFIPSARQPNEGTLVHVVGNPMTGFNLEFKRNYSPDDNPQPYTKDFIGLVLAEHIIDTEIPRKNIDVIPTCKIEDVAKEVQPPGKSRNFLAPVDGINNRRCQEWTLDYIQRLVDDNLLDRSAIAIVNSKRDPPTLGVGLKAVHGNGE